MTVGYIDGSALIASLSAGPAGDRAAAIWSSFDATCTAQFSEVEVPSAIGRNLDRVAWVWAINSLSVVMANEEVHRTAIDLAWLGAPPAVAIHVAAAQTTQVDHFLTANTVAAQWADVRGLNVIVV